jgi:hypothetical protein
MTTSIDNLTKQEAHFGAKTWSSLEKIAFRFAFIFLLLLVLPLKWRWYEQLFAVDGLYEFLNTIASYRVNFLQVETESGRWGAGSYATWGLATLIAASGAAIWTIASRYSKRQEYNTLYYWLLVLVRYRIAIGLIAFGFVKFFPMQMPFPSLANLNTEIGDYAPFKLYWQIVGISFRYEIFLGFLEIAAGILMLFRTTTIFGAIINVGVLFNVAHANLGYDGGVHVYASYFVLLSFFILVRYIPGIWALFIQRESVSPNYYTPDFSKNWRKPVYIGSKLVFVFLFLVFYGYSRYDRFYNHGRLKEPVVPGLPGAAGFYQVSSFVLNGDTLQDYSPLDSVRWHNAIFERYSTFVYKVNKPFDIALGNGGPGMNDLLKDYELTGRAGGKVYLYYEIDSVENHLYLVDKSQKFSRELNRQFSAESNVGLKELYNTPIGEEIKVLRWDYQRPAEGKIALSGIDANSDTISVVLDRVDRIYLLGKEWYIENHKYTY